MFKDRERFTNLLVAPTLHDYELLISLNTSVSI